VQSNNPCASVETRVVLVGFSRTKRNQAHEFAMQSGWIFSDPPCKGKECPGAGEAGPENEQTQRVASFGPADGVNGVDLFRPTRKGKEYPVQGLSRGFKRAGLKVSLFRPAWRGFLVHTNQDRV